MRSAIDEMNRVLDRAPPLCKEALKDETRLTSRWRHGAIHDRTLPMADHVVMTYYSAPQRIEWRDGSRHERSLTRSGAITLIPGGHEARWDIPGPIEVSHVYLPNTRIQACADVLSTKGSIMLLDRVGFADVTAAHLLEILAREAANTVCPSRLIVEQAIDLLCLHLIRAHSAVAYPVLAAPCKGLAEWQVRRIHGYLLENLDRDVGLDELAGLLRLSRFHFCTAFRQATGLTPNRFFVGLRIARARELLRDLRKPITEIAAAVGYQTPSSFATAFRAAMGISPSEFRRRL